MHLYAQTSVPRLLFGHNARLPSEIEAWEGARSLACYTENRTGLPFTLETATISEIHYTRDVAMGDAAATAPLRLYNRTLPRFSKRTFEHSLYFQNRSVTIRIYDKFAEVRTKKGYLPDAIHAAHGNLRIEYAARRPGVEAIRKRLNLQDCSPASLVSQDVSQQVLDKLCSDLDLDRLCEETGNLQRLLGAYSIPKAWRLFGYLKMIEAFGERFYSDPRWSFNKREFDRARRDCKRAGAYPNILDNIGTL